jgi:putative FmdB family regulatory protein
MWYDYKCIACEIQLEVVKPMSKSHEIPKCPVCHQLMERQWGTPGISVIKQRPHGFYPPERLEVKR